MWNRELLTKRWSRLQMLMLVLVLVVILLLLDLSHVMYYLQRLWQ